MTQDELKLVLEALKWCHGGEPCGTAEAIAVVEKALAQPEQDDGMCTACENNLCTAKQRCVALDNPPQPEPDWKGLVLAHNAECEERCDKERCGYAPYFEANGRRCPTCPVYEKIDVDTVPPQRKPLTDEEIADIFRAQRMVYNTDGVPFARAIEQAHGIKE